MLQNKDRLLGLLVGVIAFVVYLMTLAPGLYYTDSGELAAAASVWGVAHPTGYPLYTLIAHLWTYLPWPSAIYGLNVLAAVFMAVTTTLFYHCLAQLPLTLSPSKSKSSTSTNTITLSDYQTIRLASSLLLAFTPVFWAQATSTEVYSLHALLFTATLYATLLTTKHPDDQRYTVLAGLLLGLMLANHVSSIFLAPGFLHIWYWRSKVDGQVARRLRESPWLLVPALLGPSLYALLPLRSASLPPINWGWVHRGWDAFLYHVKGTQFGIWMFTDDAAVKDNFNVFITIASEQFLWVGWLLVVWGLIRNKRSLTVGLLTIVAGNLAISLGYGIHDIEPYFLPTLITLMVFFVIGAASALQRLPKAAPALLVLPVIAGVLNYGSADLSKHTAVYDYTRWTLANAEPNAIIITRQWDFLCSAFWYLQAVDGFRTDVVMIDKELLRRTWYAPYLQQLYPDVMKGAKAQVDDYMTWLEKFEEDADAFNASRQNSMEIQTRFVALLNAIVDCDRPIYVTPEILTDEEGFAPQLTRMAAGPLVRLARPGESVRPVLLYRVDELAASLEGREGRLDQGLRKVSSSSLAITARFELDRGDTQAFLRLRDAAAAIDASEPTVRALYNMSR